MVATVALATLLSSCAPSISADTMRSIVAVESGGNPYAIHDNTTSRAYFPQSRAQAVAILAAARSHNLDVGISQVNASWFPTFGVSATQMLEPCRNLRIGSVVLSRAYRDADARFPGAREALWHALSAYNTGSLYAGAGYVTQVVDAALARPLVPSITLLTTSAKALAEASIRRPERRPAPPSVTARIDVYRAHDRNERSSTPGTGAAVHQL